MPATLVQPIQYMYAGFNDGLKTIEGTHMSVEKYKREIERIANEGERLYLAMLWETLPKEQKKRAQLDEEAVKKLPNFKDDYQTWYSEAVACISQLLPGRL